MGVCLIKKSTMQDLSIKDLSISNSKIPNQLIPSPHLSLSPTRFSSLWTNNPKTFSAYTNYQQIGEGGFSIVYSVIDTQEKTPKAIKILPKKTIEYYEVQNEVLHLEKCDHPNIIKLLDFFEEKKEYCLVTELCRGPSLYNKLSEKGIFNEEMGAFCMKQILSALKYCHKEKIIYGDIKLENILFLTTEERSTLKLIDFGIAQTVKKEGNKAVRGTIYYMAPEIFEEVISTASDIWSCGVLMYFMLTGDFPFKGICFTHVLNNIQKRKLCFNWKKWHSLSEEARDLMMKMLTLNPHQRISAEEAYIHPWISKSNLEES